MPPVLPAQVLLLAERLLVLEGLRAHVVGDHFHLAEELRLLARVLTVRLVVGRALLVVLALELRELLADALQVCLVLRDERAVLPDLRLLLLLLDEVVLAEDLQVLLHGALQVLRAGEVLLAGDLEGALEHAPGRQHELRAPAVLAREEAPQRAALLEHRAREVDALVELLHQAEVELLQVEEALADAPVALAELPLVLDERRHELLEPVYLPHEVLLRELQRAAVRRARLRPGLDERLRRGERRLALQQLVLVREAVHEEPLFIRLALLWYLLLWCLLLYRGRRILPGGLLQGALLVALVAVEADGLQHEEHTGTGKHAVDELARERTQYGVQRYRKYCTRDHDVPVHWSCESRRSARRLEGKGGGRVSEKGREKCIQYEDICFRITVEQRKE